LSTYFAEPRHGGAKGDEVGAFHPEIPAGAVTVHHARTLHYAGPNTTANPRRAYILVMNAPPRPAERPDARPWLIEEQEALAER
jgi:ectoine hydroxylase-related dioxygenase (phytanoyl-CoA dioxygenase family)